MLDLSEYVFSFDVFFFFFKQKTAYEMRISDWSSDVCSSDLRACRQSEDARRPRRPDSGASRSRHPRRPRRPAGQPADRRQHPYPSQQIGRASCRERVCQYVSISVVAVSLKKKKHLKDKTDKDSRQISTNTKIYTDKHN